MKGKILLLGIGYALWNIVSSAYSWNKNTAFRKKLREAEAAGEDTKMMILSHVTETHKNLFNELNDKYVTEENKAYLKEQWENLKIIMKEYKIEGEKLIAEMKENPEEGFDLIADKFQDLYDRKKWELDRISWEAPEQIGKLKDNLLAKFEEFKWKMKS